MDIALFISYRRADSGGHAGRLYDRLRHWFDDDALFYDLDGIDMGDVFPARIETAINAASVVLVVIGPVWLDELNRRVELPGVDFVRREVELALARRECGDIPLILPVLMGGAAMPSATQLHPTLQTSLAPLCMLDAHTFQGKQADWDQQFLRLRERLAQVPGIPEPRFRAPAGGKQPFHIIEQSLSPHFQDPTGRLSHLREWLVASEDAPSKARAVLFGMGGVGKTQMALKYSYDYRDSYAGVWWFRAESETTLQLDAQEACQTVSAPSEPGEVPSTAFKSWLDRQQGTWLLVYDNAEECTTLRSHLPEGGHHHLIITSRNPAWGGIAQPMEMEIWLPEQGADFLVARLLPGASRADLLQLSHDLGGLPLALEQAASYIEETGCTVAAYCALLNGIDTEGLILDEGRAATGYERTVAATLTLAFAKLNPAAQQLLRLCAYGAPAPLPERFFLEAGESLPEQLANAASQPLAWNRVVGELRHYGVARRLALPALDRSPNTLDTHTEQALSLHRLTQQTTRARFSQPAEDCAILLQLLMGCCPTDPALPDHWPRYAAIAPHMTQLDRYYNNGLLDHRSYSWLLNQVGRYLGAGPALYAESAHWLSHAVEIDQKDLGDQHPDTLTSMHNLAVTLRDQGDLDGARQLQEKVLEARQRLQGDQHPHTSSSAWNLFCTIDQMGDHSKARNLLRTHLLWLLERDPETLGAVQRQIREMLIELKPHSSNNDEQTENEDLKKTATSIPTQGGHHEHP